jgi:glycosyltransferase involved in cell wall biosynthesis
MRAGPAVSVVMTAFNVAEFVGPAIDSALAQTWRDFELIVVDDGSTDGTLEIVRQIADPRMSVTALPHRGVSVQLQAAIELARAPYVAFLDGDDLWSPDKLERHVEFLKAHPDADFTFSWSRIIDARGQDTGLTTRLWKGPISFSELLADNVIGNGSATVLRRKALDAAGGIDSTLEACHDLDSWLRIALLRPRNLWAIPEYLTFYRRRLGQLTCDVPLMTRSFDRVIEKLRRLAPDEVAQVEKQARSNMERFFAYGWYQSGQCGKSVRQMGRSFLRAPALFIADSRNWLMSAAALAGLFLPSRLHRRLRPSPARASGA